MYKQLNEIILVENELIIDFDAHLMWHKDKPNNKITITAKIYDVLVFLWDNKNSVVENRTLLDKLWADDYDCEVNVIKDTISKLRNIIRDICPDDLDKRFIENRPRYGYIIPADGLHIETISNKNEDTNSVNDPNPSPELTQNIYGGLVINNNGNVNFYEHADTVNIE